MTSTARPRRNRPRPRYRPRDADPARPNPRNDGHGDTTATLSARGYRAKVRGPTARPTWSPRPRDRKAIRPRRGRSVLRCRRGPQHQARALQDPGRAEARRPVAALGPPSRESEPCGDTWLTRSDQLSAARSRRRSTSAAGPATQLRRHRTVSPRPPRCSRCWWQCSPGGRIGGARDWKPSACCDCHRRTPPPRPPSTSRRRGRPNRANRRSGSRRRKRARHRPDKRVGLVGRDRMTGPGDRDDRDSGRAQLLRPG